MKIILCVNRIILHRLFWTKVLKFCSFNWEQRIKKWFKLKPSLDNSQSYSRIKIVFYLELETWLYKWWSLRNVAWVRGPSKYRVDNNLIQVALIKKLDIYVPGLLFNFKGTRYLVDKKEQRTNEGHQFIFK